ncbi:MAG: YIP1 family protein [Candidatus Symbiothrix sp.]|jgi:hypothetical protein|nr:YIP1 family protein [Candidatus Symbiothrix sp.]
MLKELFVLLFRLITEPRKTWERLAQKEEKRNEDFYKNYLYPVFGIVALLSFVGILFSVGKFDIQQALKTVIKQIAVYFGGFYLASFILSEWVILRFKQRKDLLLAERFVGYSSALVYVVAMIKSLFPSFFFLLLILLFSSYIIWQGAIRYLEIQEESLVKFTITASMVILLSPVAIEYAIFLLLPGMKI